jgi:hypothetical protein
MGVFRIVVRRWKREEMEREEGRVREGRGKKPGGVSARRVFSRSEGVVGGGEEGRREKNAEM